MASVKRGTKKVINSSDTCVDDSLRGIVALYPYLHLHPRHRVITIRRQTDSGKVAVLGGGGSGHEPFAAGLVGLGLLDGAVAGDIFTSPPTGHILYAISALHQYNSGGVLVILGNYTGDRLTFGKAIEKAKTAGMKVEGLIFGDDVASCNNKTGGRGMCGEIFCYKLCGAMAARGYDLESIRNHAVKASKSMATLGVSLSSCSLPGQPQLFEIADDEIEVGIGVHGEAGIEKIKMAPANQLVSMMLDQIIDKLQLIANNRVAAMVNNLGGTTLLEMNIISAEIKQYLENKNLQVERIYSGHLMTSLDMHGFQICLFHLNTEHGDLWLQLLDDVTEVVGWPGGKASVKIEERHLDDESLVQANKKKMIPSGPKISSQRQYLLQGSLQAASEALIENEELLNRLDSGCGDGDCGNTLKKFGEAILRYLPTASMEYLSTVLCDLSKIAETDMGGTSGGIYSLGLSAASQAIAEAQVIDVSTWLVALQRANNTIQTYGGAEPGDRTMLDTLHAVARTLENNLSENLQTLLTEISTSADESAKATTTMTAR